MGTNLEGKLPGIFRKQIGKGRFGTDESHPVGREIKTRTKVGGETGAKG